MGWYDRKNTFQRTIANPYFQTKSGTGGGGSALAPATHYTGRQGINPEQIFRIGQGILDYMGRDDSKTEDNLWTVTPEGQWAIKSEEVQSPEAVLKLPQEEQQQYFRQMIYGDPREASANQWLNLPDFMKTNGALWP